MSAHPKQMSGRLQSVALDGVGLTGGGGLTGPDRRVHRHAGTRRAIRSIKAQHASHRTPLQVMADTLTRAASSSTFLLLHALWFGAWIGWNVGLFGLPRFDPYPFGLLTMVVSLEAIFLSIFVLMSQGREAAIAEIREEVTLAVNLRTEEEVTKTLQLVAGLYSRLGQQLGEDDDLHEMLGPLDAEAMERDLLAQIAASTVTSRISFRRTE